MAEMIAQEAIAWLTEDKAFGQECYSRKQIADLIQQQAAEIEQRWWNPFRLGDLPKNGLDDVSDLLTEVRKLQEKLQYEETCHAEAQEEVRRLNRMVDKAVDWLYERKCPVEDGYNQFVYCTEDDRGNCFECVRKYLESEVADK